MQDWTAGPPSDHMESQGLVRKIALFCDDSVENRSKDGRGESRFVPQTGIRSHMSIIADETRIVDERDYEIVPRRGVGHDRMIDSPPEFPFQVPVQFGQCVVMSHQVIIRGAS